jgi:hypothetical protein
MGITIDFLFKHVRPFGMDGVEAYFSDAWRTYVTETLHIADADLSLVAEAWTRTALADPGRQQDAFIQTATIVTNARGQELWRPRDSTILFLNGDQLRLLSNASEAAGPNKTIVVDYSSDPIAIAVSVDRNDRVTVDRGLKGINVSTDASGNVNHYPG